MIKVTTPIGVCYIKKESITAIADAVSAGPSGNMDVKCNVWLYSCEHPFNILEDTETVYNLINSF